MFNLLSIQNLFTSKVVFSELAAQDNNCKPDWDTCGNPPSPNHGNNNNTCKIEELFKNKYIPYNISKEQIKFHRPV